MLLYNNIQQQQQQQREQKQPKNKLKRKRSKSAIYYIRVPQYDIIIHLTENFYVKSIKKKKKKTTKITGKIERKQMATVAGSRPHTFTHKVQQIIVMLS